MGAIAIAVAAASTALATFHHTRPIYLSFNRSRICTLVTSSVSSSHSCSSSTEFDITFAPPKPKTRTTPSLDTDSDSVSESGQEDHHQQLFIPWIVHDENENLTLQSTPPSHFLHAMANKKTTTSKKKKEKDSKVKSVASPKAGLSKAARRFYNENFGNPPQRLSKVLAAAGVASRRSSEDLIFQGCVTVNGSVCNTPQTRVHPARDVIYVNGNRLPKKLPQKVYLALNKPKGYICSAGEKETKSVISLFDDYLKSWDKRNKGRPKPRLFTVGRLDVATTGLLIVTNDGEFAQKLSHPSSNLSKEYIVTIDGAVYKRHLIAISEGTVIDAVHCTPDFVELLPQQPGVSRTRLRIVVHEGRNHEVRELVKNAGLQVHSLKRMRIGGFRLPAVLAIGKHIELTQANLKALGWKDNDDADEGVREGTRVTPEMISGL